ncbi:hypothetical protein [Paenibacillus glacialis]|uniref:RNA polymerase subunit sigma n=1 Tax=Paenibacillus glacialis TaxID=494026 RepID=A0A168K0T4_9BACL|nr:hypothetical protein PGLA_16270 [Paenibacillus glacialis]
MKSVELQIAVPRTQEAGKIQNEFHQRSAQEQSLLMNQQIKESLEMRQRSSGVAETAKSLIREEGKQQHSSESDGQSASNQQEHSSEHHPAEHPYKGHHIDLSL